MTILQFRSMGTAPYGSGPFYNIMHVSTSDGAEQATVNGVAGLLETFYTDIAGQMPAGTIWQPAERVTSVSEPPTIYTPATPPAPVPGNPGSGAAAPQLAACVSWRTSKAGSRYRGRTYLGPMASGTMDANGKFTAAVAAVLQSAAAALLTGIPALDIGGGAAFLGVYSRKYATIETITGVVVNTTVDTQRRRN